VDNDDDEDDKEIYIGATGLLHAMFTTNTTLGTKTSTQEIQRTCVSERLTVTSWISSSVTLLCRLPNSILYRVVEKKRGQGPPCTRHIAKATPAAT